MKNLLLLLTGFIDKYWIIIIAVCVVLLIILLVVRFVVFRKVEQHAKRYKKALTRAEKYALQAPYVMTDSIVPRLYPIADALINSLYTQNVNGLPYEDMDYEAYIECYNQLKYEYENRIKNSVNKIEFLHKEIGEQSATTMERVDYIRVRYVYMVDMLQNHQGNTAVIQKTYRQSFIFAARDSKWVILEIEPKEECSPDEPIIKPIGKGKKKNNKAKFESVYGS